MNSIGKDMNSIGKWFVMMYSQNGNHVMPLVDENDCTMLWDTEGEANDAARGNPYAHAFGFQAYEVGS
jgi:hypothetical protein